MCLSKGNIIQFQMWEKLMEIKLEQKSFATDGKCFNSDLAIEKAKFDIGYIDAHRLKIQGGWNVFPGVLGRRSLMLCKIQEGVQYF